MTDLVLEFTQIAEVLVQIIVDELHSPDYSKLVKPTNLGGVAGTPLHSPFCCCCCCC